MKSECVAILKQTARPQSGGLILEVTGKPEKCRNWFPGDLPVQRLSPENDWNLAWVC